MVIDTQTAEEHSICRPTVVQHHGAYHMWYCARGDRYQLGYAWSLDGVAWTRADQLLGLGLSADGFDDKSQAYPNVFEHGDWLYMLYAGNDYGAAGLGMARLPLDALPRHR